VISWSVAAPPGTAEATPASASGAPTPAQAALDRKIDMMDQSRENLMLKLGTLSYTVIA